MQVTKLDMRIVFCNTDSLKNAKTIASSLVEKKIAACVSIIPKVISIYEWEGKIENREEYTLKIKTIESKLNIIESEILSLHGDQVPEIITIKVSEVFDKYEDWVSGILV
ncbi:divalent-cation tolerance protein CutA [Candidatus Kapabacteria bacterium]|nr:divalent-cation tolerance protein CutA [Candidatus Kapabacteria bacterium]